MTSALLDTDLNRLQWSFRIDGPTGATMHCGFGTSRNDDEWILEALRHEHLHEGTEYMNGNSIAGYISSFDMIQPMEEENQLMVVQWKDDSGNIICTEKLIYSIEYTNTDPKPVTIRRMPAELIIGDNQAKNDGVWADKVDMRVSDGELRYTVELAAGESVQIDTLIRCPKPLSEVDEDSGWTFWCGDAYEMHPDDALRTVTVDGVEYLAADIGSERFSSGSDYCDVQALILEWRDADGNVVEDASGSLNIVKYVGEPKVFAAYVEEWEPVARSQISAIDAINAVDGLSLSYTDGILHMGVEEGKVPSGAKLADVQFSVTVTPPAGAVAYKENHSGGNNIYGEDDFLYRDQGEIMERDAELRPLNANNQVVLELWPFREFYSDKLNLTVYLNGDLTSEFAGGMTLIFWYDASGEIISKQWIVERTDALERVEYGKVLESEDEIETELVGDTITRPAIIVHENGAKGSYKLHITTYPQDGENCVYYELKLVDNKGRYAELPGKCTLFIPYPNGAKHDIDFDGQYKLYHYDGEHNLKEGFIDGRDIVRTKQGLWIEVNSLSPFVLSWEEKDSAAQSTLVLPGALTAIGEEAFINGSFDTVIIPESCSYIGKKAFAGVENLEVYLPKHDQLVIEADAFEESAIMH